MANDRKMSGLSSLKKTLNCWKRFSEMALKSPHAICESKYCEGEIDMLTYVLEVVDGLEQTHVIIPKQQLQDFLTCYSNCKKSSCVLIREDVSCHNTKCNNFYDFSELLGVVPQKQKKETTQP